MKNDNLVKVFFERKEGDDYNSESMWAEGLNRDTFRLDNVPFFIYGISCNDIFDTYLKEDNFFFKSIVKRGGHSTLRIFFFKQNEEEQQIFIQKIHDLGGAVERSSKTYIAIDIPSGVDISQVIDLCKSGEEKGLWEYEEKFIYKQDSK